MNEIANMMVALVAGALTGALFFGGLWFTVQKGVNSKVPALWFLVSFILRVGITLLSFYFIAHNHWLRLPVALIGFLIARYIITRITKPYKEKQIQQKEITQS